MILAMLFLLLLVAVVSFSGGMYVQKRYNVLK